MKIKLESNFKNNLKGEFGKYDFRVGILEDGPHKDARRGQRGLGGSDVRSSYAGGPVRKKSRHSSMTLYEVSEANMDRLGFNYLVEPFKKTSTDILKFARSFLRLLEGKDSKKRVENYLQAIVRNPILRGEYGPQSPLTTAIKGFNRPMIDTAQLFKSIKAIATLRGKRGV